MLHSYDLVNQKRDLSAVLSTVIQDEPRFISDFPRVADASSRKHEWLEDQLGSRQFLAAGSGSSLIASTSLSGCRVGTLIARKGSPALFQITSISGSTVGVMVAADNGAGLPASGFLPTASAPYLVVSTPMSEGSANGDGEEAYAQSGVSWNATQIFRREIVLSGSAMAVNVYGEVDNQLNRQTAFALAELARDLNRVALFGRRSNASSGTGEAGGLYYFYSQSGAQALDAGQARLDSFLINDAAQRILGEGGAPRQILCSPGQARILSNEYRGNLQIMRSDLRRGAYVAMIVNEINGESMTILADPDLPDTDAWVLDPSGFGLAALNGRAITDMDATTGGFDGIRRIALGELTFEFKNVAQRCCRIRNLQESTAALTSLRTAVISGGTVNLSGGTVNLSGGTTSGDDDDDLGNL